MVLGKNFGTDASKVSVSLGETEMSVTEVGKSVIKFTVPATLKIGTYPLRTQVSYTDTEGREQTVSHTFEVDFEVRGRTPEITGYKPATGIYRRTDHRGQGVRFRPGTRNGYARRQTT